MIVDSTALPEQAVRDIIASGFQSAGQRCSALRVLYIQEDVADTFSEMLFGAMDELTLGDPWGFTTDVGPVINEAAANGIRAHIQTARSAGPLDERTASCPTRAPSSHQPCCASTASPIWIPKFSAPSSTSPPSNPNSSIKSSTTSTPAAFGLTFGMHSRIDDRVDSVTARLNVGNMYINRNQIGAIVGSQPFGGEGLSGTGPKGRRPKLRETLHRNHDTIQRHTKRRNRRYRRCPGRAKHDVRHPPPAPLLRAVAWPNRREQSTLHLRARHGSLPWPNRQGRR